MTSMDVQNFQPPPHRSFRRVVREGLASAGLLPLAQRARWWSKAAANVAAGRRGATNFAANQLAYERGEVRIPMPPVHITIEPANICDMGCPVCETGAGIMQRPRGYMSLDNFKRIVDHVAPHTNTLFFYFMGEPFLNRYWYEMLRYAKAQGIPFINTCTNGHFIDAEQVVRSGIDEISFQIGGVTQATHEVYRVGGDLQKTLRNCHETVLARNRQGLKKPRIALGFILMKHNELEVGEFHRIAKEIGVDDATVIDPCVRTVFQGKQYLPTNSVNWFYNREEFEQRQVLVPKELNDGCPWIYHSLVVCWNGDIVPCCRDPQGKFVMGNLLNDNLETIWNGGAYTRFRERVLTEQGTVSICKLCSSYPPPDLH